MRHSLVSCTLVGALLPALWCGAHPALAVSEEEALSDWNALASAYATMEQKVEARVPSYVANLIGEDHEAALATLDEFDRTDRPEIEKLLRSIEQKYGRAPDQIDRAMAAAVQIDWRSEKHPTKQAGAFYAELLTWLENIDEAKKGRAQELLRQASTLEERIRSHPELASDEKFDEISATLEMALLFDPDLDEAKKRLDQVDDDREEIFSAVREKIDEATFPDHYDNFAGPGDPHELALSAMKWLQNDEANRGDADPDRTLAVSISGDWVSAKTDLLGQTIQWGLPIHGVCTNNADEAKGLARVFELTILTREGAGIEKAPPWTGVWVGDNYTMLLSKVPSMRGGGRTTAGLVGRIFWLALVLGNLAVGLLLASSLLRSKAPVLGKAIDALQPHAERLGVVVLAIGLLAFLRALLLYFAPLADLLPQLSAVFAGLLLGRAVLGRRREPYAGGDEPGAPTPAPPAGWKAIVDRLATSARRATVWTRDWVARHENQFDRIGRNAVPLGVACLALGLLHLLIGWVTLF